MFVEQQVEVHSENQIAGVPRGATIDRAHTTAVELGIWLSGIESFLASAHPFNDLRDPRQRTDSSKEFGLLHAGLQRSSVLTLRLASFSNISTGIDPNGLRDLSTALREIQLLSEGLIASPSLGPSEWRAWAALLRSRFAGLPAYRSIIRYAEADGRENLPGILKDLAFNQSFLSPEHTELALALPKFAVVMKWLDVVGRMLKADEPLKPALLIFARVNEQIFELTSYVNNRLERFPDEEADLFASLDAASYTASIELKKVYSQELAGVAAMRPTPSIYARIETAHSLLKEGFEQILAGFARLIDPDTDVFTLFPDFHIKLEQSITLRQELWDITRLVQTAESKPNKAEIEKMQAELRRFLGGTVKFLFYKDTETVERFAEEILVTKQNKDLVPILHRFGAYLETLFGQVCLRAVLERHPFASNGDI